MSTTREILFRGKSLKTGEWAQGYLFRCWERAYILWGMTNDNADMTEVDSETVCQYTGLTDKNGRKIFEGDIVKDIFNDSVFGIVRYDEYRNTFNDDERGGHVGFYVEWQDKKNLFRKDIVYWVKNSEFIGNIYDNPELLDEVR